MNQLDALKYLRAQVSRRAMTSRKGRSALRIVDAKIASLERKKQRRDRRVQYVPEAAIALGYSEAEARRDLSRN